MNRAIGVRLSYAPGHVRALIVNALNEKAAANHAAAADLRASKDPAITNNHAYPVNAH